ncbi:hypothetical protein ACFSYH_12820 [Populibacterium corticicola]|uniref:Uncharacterized protein n=1 Tax=Populibacterium corticicola TaxID=1812826 RepID=A0ABW5XGH6_9MICO
MSNQPESVSPAPIAEQQPARTRVRYGTLVWGLIIATIGVVQMLGSLGYTLDLQLILIIALGVCGVLLVGSSIARSTRS